MTDPAGPAAREQVLKEFLAIHDVACPRCGYNLRASESVRCPECAATLDLRVGSPDLRLVPWITAIVGTSIPAGFTAVFSVLTILTAFVDGFSNAGERNTAVFCWIVTAVLGSLIVTLARRRSVFLRKPPHRQRMLAVAAIVFSLIAVSTVTVLGVVFVRF